MIDVIFFLLVFFMLTSLTLTRLHALPVALPKTETAARAERANVTLTITRAGGLLVDRAPVTLESLGEALAHAMASDPQQTVVVNADEGAAYGRVIQAMDRARKVGVRKFALASERDAGAPAKAGGTP